MYVNNNTSRVFLIVDIYIYCTLVSPRQTEIYVMYRRCNNCFFKRVDHSVIKHGKYLLKSVLIVTHIAPTSRKREVRSFDEGTVEISKSQMSSVVHSLNVDMGLASGLSEYKHKILVNHE